MDQQFEKIKAIESKIQKLIELNKNLAEEKPCMKMKTVS